MLPLSRIQDQYAKGFNLESVALEISIPTATDTQKAFKLAIIRTRIYCFGTKYCGDICLHPHNWSGFAIIVFLGLISLIRLCV
jgi:hypothetical protein